MKNRIPVWGLIFLICLGFFSCTVARKDLLYFQGNLDSLKYTKVEFPEPVIQKGDLLMITVSSLNEEESAKFQMPMQAGGGGGGGGQQGGMGYLVDSYGNIPFPVLGNMHVEGLKRSDLVNILKIKLETYLKDPVISVRFTNFRITVMGEVSNPGTFVIPNERANLLDALTLSGDLTIFSKRKTILVIREEGNHRTYGRVDITNADAFNSPYFNLHKNDIVYVEMNNRKVLNDDQTLMRGVQVTTTILSIVFLITTIIR